MSEKTTTSILLNYKNEAMTLQVNISFNIYSVGDVKLGAVLDKNIPYSTGDDITFTFTITNNSLVLIDTAILECKINDNISNIQYSLDGYTKKLSNNNLLIPLINLKPKSNTIVFVYGKIS